MKRKLRVAMLIMAMATLVAVSMPQSASAATRSYGSRDSAMYMQYYSSGWRSLDTPQHFVVGTSPEQVAYCLQHRKTSPSSGGSSYTTTDTFDSYSLTTRRGLQIILEQGYPYNTNGLSSNEARYATANAIRFWLSEREYYEGGRDDFYNFTDFHQYGNSELRTMAASGKIGSKIRTRSGYNNRVLQFAIDLLIKARNQEVLAQSVNFSGSALTLHISGGYFVGSTTVTLTNCKKYKLNSSLPTGSVISGYTGNNGDVLTFRIPISAANAGVSYGISATGLDDRARSNMFANMPVSSSYQSLVAVTPGESFFRGVASENMTLKTPAMPDLTVSKLVTDKSSYQPGETIKVTATISNYGNGAVGSAKVSLAPSGLSTQIKTIGYLGPAKSTNVTYTFTAPNYTKDTNITLLATVDPNNLIKELSESNNTRNTLTIVKAALPDLVVQTLTTDKTVYEVGETVTVKVRVKNNGYTTAGASTLMITPSGMSPLTATIPALSSGVTSAEQTFTFTTPVAMTDTQVKITAKADASGVVKELNESNNTRDTIIMILALKPDLTFGDDSTIVSSYYAGKDIVIAAQVCNIAMQGVPSVEVKLQLGSATKTETICVPGNGINIVVFRVAAPPETGTYPVLMTIDPANKIAEINENNNKTNEDGTIKYDGSTGAVKTGAIALARNDLPDPVDTRMEDDHLARNKSVPTLPTLAKSASHTWTEYRYENGKYVQHSYSALLNTTFLITPDPRVAIKDYPDMMESGFGVSATATTRLTTNYDHPEKLVGPQMYWAFYPETSYWTDNDWSQYADALEYKSGNLGQVGETTWQYAVSPYSVTESRLHYTPVYFPDGMYEAVGQAFYGWSPAGQMYQQLTDTVEIEGDMYDRFPVLNR